jgi:glycosyltransferase involved in cell wall biosynthesis
MKCPELMTSVVIADDAHRAASLSSVLARANAYLPVMDGPRLTRPDADAETVRRNNAVARIDAQAAFYVNLPPDAEQGLDRYFRSLKPRRVSTDEDVAAIASERQFAGEPLLWGRENIGLGLLIALRTRRLLTFGEAPSPSSPVPSKSGHVVVCERGEDMTEVIAANYAFALGAGLLLIDERPRHETAAILEAFYGLYDEPDVAPRDRLRELALAIRGFVGDPDLPEGGSLTFVTDGIPYGFAFPERPSTHLFKYPDVGLTVINGFANGQRRARGTNVAVLIDPKQADAPEIPATSVILAKKGMFVRVHNGAGATVLDVTRMVENYPYDLLLFATHCGDVDGYRWTYEFTDGDGRDRRLVVDIAIGIGDPRKSADDKLNVMQFMRFRELDGVRWDDPDRDRKIEVGRAIQDFVEWDHAGRLEPVLKETIPRVVNSAALKMYDHNYIAMPQWLANNSCPVIINNACTSWHELPGRFTFAGARAYVGTLFPVTTSEACDVVVNALDKHGDKVLPHAFWSSQKGVYGDGARRPYVVTGVYPQRIRVPQEDTPKRLLREMRASLADWRLRAEARRRAGQDVRSIEEIIAFFEEEIRTFGSRFIRPTKP